MQQIFRVAREGAQYDGITVEPFFNDDSNDALLSQVQWFEKSLRVDDDFFLDMLNLERREFSQWKYERGSLSSDKQDLLKEFWQMMLHMMSFYDYDMTRVAEAFHYTGEGHFEHSTFGPPWTGTSLRNYLEKAGPISIRKVNHWIQALRYGNWYW